MPSSAAFIEGSNVSIGHLGIVAGAFDSLGIAGVIDRAIPKTRPHHLTHGTLVKAMVLNGLGFIERRLYLYPEFFSDIAVDRFLGSSVTPEQLNDDVLGRTLDAIAAYGPTELFNELVATCLLASDYGTPYIPGIRNEPRNKNQNLLVKSKREAKISNIDLIPRYVSL